MTNPAKKLHIASFYSFGLSAESNPLRLFFAGLFFIFLSFLIFSCNLQAAHGAKASPKQLAQQIPSSDAPADPDASDPDASDLNAPKLSDEEAESDAEADAEPLPTVEQAKPKTNINDITPPKVERDLSKLPFPVRRMRELLIEAAKSGDLETLRPYIGSGDDQTMLSLGEMDGDPIQFLKSESSDGEGNELLAILWEVLDAGYVIVDEGTDRELYVWPYFFSWPLEKLTAPEKVELYRLITHGDYQDMKDFGAYIFYRVGITPQGRWSFFVAGD